jgi:hypothetical protein
MFNAADTVIYNPTFTMCTVSQKTHIQSNIKITVKTNSTQLISTLKSHHPDSQFKTV